MATKIIVRIVPGGMMAAGPVESEKLNQFRGKEMMVTISQPRNLKFHKKFFGLLGVAREMADTELNREQFRTYVTAGAGYCDYIEDANGGCLAVPKSISFAAMGNDEFERLYQDCLNFICQTWVLDNKQINEILNFM